MIAAAGISDKASRYLSEDGIEGAILGLIETFLEPAGLNFVDELVYRFLLTRGDTLGGSMRNLVGFLSQRRLSTSIAAALTIAGTPFQWMHSQSKQWFSHTNGSSQDIESARGISWCRQGVSRTLLYNIKIPISGNNVDLCIFNCNHNEFNNGKIKSDASRYIALGELKGGIDPAGADERWKTAKTAIGRIFNAFSDKGCFPSLFFIGAAIEKRMAQEIWKDLRAGKLANAANLTKSDHITAICNWLINL